MKRTQSFAVPIARSLALSFAVLAFVAPAAMAASKSTQATEDDRNILRTVVYYSYPTGEQDIPVVVLTENGPEFFPKASFEAQEAPGFTFSYERKLKDCLGVSLGVSWVRYVFDATLDETSSQLTFVRLGKQTVVPITATVLWHPLKRPVADWYVGAGYAYVRYGDLRNGNPGFRFEADSDRGFVAQTGVDMVVGASRRRPQGPRWAVNLDIRYIRTQSNSIQASSQGIDIDPIDISLGASARF